MPRPALVRYGGLAGSLLLAVAAYRSGAGWPWHPTMTPRTILAGESGVLAPICWLLGTAGMIAAWWCGRTAIPSARWAYVTAALWVVPLLPLLPLGSYDIYSYACQGWQQSAGLDPYSGGVDALGCPWRDAVAPTWLDSAAPYGPVFVVLAAAAAKLGGSLAGTIAALRIVSLLGVALTAACLPVLARRAAVPLSRAVWLVLACPLVAVHLISGGHNDAVMVGLVVAGLAVIAANSPSARDPAGSPASLDAARSVAALDMSREAPVVAGRRLAVLVAAGVLLGLAAGVKATAVVVLPFAVLMAVPPGSPLRTLWRPAAALAGGAVAAVAAVSVAAGLGLGWVAGLTGSGASVQWTSPPTAVGMTVDLIGSAFGAHWNAVPVTRALGVAGLAAVLAAVWWRSRRGNPLLGAGLALAATVVLSPVFHPWYATWPLAVLAATLPRDTLWLVAPCALAAALCLPDGYNLALAVKSQGAIAMTAFVVVMAVLAVRRRARERQKVAP
jgi:alpha-1,6-mannosyltransferase